MNSTGKWYLAFWALIGLGVCTPQVLAMEPVQVPLGENLQQDAYQSRQTGRPIVLVFSAQYCGYCELLEEEILKPMLRSGLYEDQLILRKLMVDSYLPIASFNGTRQPPEDLKRRYGVSVTPTLVFVDDQGRELAERMVGINTVEMYGGYLDAAVEESRQILARRNLLRMGALDPAAHYPQPQAPERP